MCVAREVKFSWYWKNAPLTFYLAATLNPRLKLGVETLFNAINKNMIETNINDIFVVKTYLEQLYLECSIQMGRSETPFAHHTKNHNKKRFWTISNEF